MSARIGGKRLTPKQSARIGIDGDVLDGKFQGSRTWLEAILVHLPGSMPEVEIVIYARHRPSEEILNHANVRWSRTPRLPGAARVFVFLQWRILADKLDLLVTQYFAPLVGPQRHVVVIHDVLDQTERKYFSAFRHIRNRILVGRSAKRSCLVVTVSDFSRRQIAEVYGRPEESTVVVRNGSHGANPSAWRRDERRPFVLFVGRLEPRKNLRLALRALDELPRDALRLVVVGRNDFEDPVVVREIMTRSDVDHLEAVSNSELSHLYRSASALLFPSLAEGWGIPIVEALSTGLPVIAARTTAIPEAGGELAYYFDPSSPQAHRRVATLLNQAARGELSVPSDKLQAHLGSLDWTTSANHLATHLRRQIEV